MGDIHDKTQEGVGVLVDTGEDRAVAVDAVKHEDAAAPEVPAKDAAAPKEASNSHINALEERHTLADKRQNDTSNSSASADARPPEPASATDAKPQAKGKAKDSAPAEGPRATPKIARRGPTNVTMPPPFSFNRFLEQMKHRSAVPVNEYVKSFLRGFSKRQYRPQDQVKLIFDFVDFISERMREASVWANLSREEFDLATEGMEKLIMNRVYTLTYSPAIAQEGSWTVQTDDLERDRVLKQRISLFSWVTEEHLDIPRGTHSDRFYAYASDELCKINQYKAPRDKIICILNCCKVVFGLIRHLGQEENADAFVPILILVVLRANPPHLVSNLEYITRFKNPNRPTSEADYYLSTLAGAITFIENMDHTSLSHIDQAEFEAKMEHAVSAYDPSNPTSPEIPSDDRSLLTQMANSSLYDKRNFFQRTGEAARQNIGAPMGALGKLLYQRIDNALAPPSQELVEQTHSVQSQQQSQQAQQAQQAQQVQHAQPTSSPAQASHLKPAPIGGYRGPATPAAAATQPETPGPGVAPNAPRRVSAAVSVADTSANDNASVSATSPVSAEISAGMSTPAARRAPQWKGGLMPRFLADNDDDDERDSPSHHVAAARYADTSADESVADESIDAETLKLGTETLRSIFPQTEDSVLVLVLQECRGNVELAIDRLLDMT
ncbi:hypothetical protein MCUN1_001429 [Malassezia cuniculi]|uniref:Vacuolar protein sorting-associated protein 9a n=1 Tax=Malassezia cuniculi TaxID=948313 RepID=A0AAF0J5U6_9BASI|nr:hypothetical protein MCUN1_001429 [Malassezia cuniculi]